MEGGNGDRVVLLDEQEGGREDGVRVSDEVLLFRDE